MNEGIHDVNIPKRDSIHSSTESAESTEWVTDALVNQAITAGFCSMLIAAKLHH